MSPPASVRPAPIAWLYLALSIVGAASTWTYNLRAMHDLGRSFTPLEFVGAGFAGSAILGSIASDFWVGSLASLVWMMIEARRLQMRGRWLYFVLTLGVAWAFALPLFLFMRERKLAEARSPA